MDKGESGYYYCDGWWDEGTSYTIWGKDCPTLEAYILIRDAFNLSTINSCTKLPSSVEDEQYIVTQNFSLDPLKIQARVEIFVCDGGCREVE